MKISLIFKNYFVEIEAKEVEFKEKVFLTGNYEKKREVHNQKELAPILKKFGISKINLFDYSFSEQLYILHKVKLIISIHGDDLACINFMKKGTSVLELIKTETNELDRPDYKFLSMASSLNIKYYYQFCKPVTNHDNGKLSKIIVDPNVLESNINKILS